MRQTIPSWAAAQWLRCVTANMIIFFRAPAVVYLRGGWSGLTGRSAGTGVRFSLWQHGISHPHTRGQTLATSSWWRQSACLISMSEESNYSRTFLGLHVTEFSDIRSYLRLACGTVPCHTPPWLPLFPIGFFGNVVAPGSQLSSYAVNGGNRGLWPDLPTPVAYRTI